MRDTQIIVVCWLVLALLLAGCSSGILYTPGAADKAVSAPPFGDIHDIHGGSPPVANCVDCHGWHGMFGVPTSSPEYCLECHTDLGNHHPNKECFECHTQRGKLGKGQGGNPPYGRGKGQQ